jgi:hypothetical protein
VPKTIYEGADDWRYKDGTKLGKVILPDGTEIDSDEAQTPISDEIMLYCLLEQRISL